MDWHFYPIAGRLTTAVEDVSRPGLRDKGEPSQHSIPLQAFPLDLFCPIKGCSAEKSDGAPSIVCLDAKECTLSPLHHTDLSSGWHSCPIPGRWKKWMGGYAPALRGLVVFSPVATFPLQACPLDRHFAQLRGVETFPSTTRPQACSVREGDRIKEGSIQASPLVGTPAHVKGDILSDGMREGSTGLSGK
jgi:hypothetical protein